MKTKKKSNERRNRPLRFKEVENIKKYVDKGR